VENPVLNTKNEFTFVILFNSVEFHFETYNTSFYILVFITLLASIGYALGDK
jgi:hypothetical protein